jgi:hypothetical protein
VLRYFCSVSKILKKNKQKTTTRITSIHLIKWEKQEMLHLHDVESMILAKVKMADVYVFFET